MENHHAINWKTHYFYGHFQKLFWHNQRVMRVQYGTMGYVLCNIYIHQLILFFQKLVMKKPQSIPGCGTSCLTLWKTMTWDLGPGPLFELLGQIFSGHVWWHRRVFFGHVSPRKIHRPTNSCRITTHKWKNQLCFRKLLGVWRMVDVFLVPWSWWT